MSKKFKIKVIKNRRGNIVIEEKIRRSAILCEDDTEKENKRFVMRCKICGKKLEEGKEAIILGEDSERANGDMFCSEECYRIFKLKE